MSATTTENEKRENSNYNFASGGYYDKNITFCDFTLTKNKH